MRTAIWIVVAMLAAPFALAQTEPGPADALWELYKQGRFEEVAIRGKALLATDNETPQVNLAVGRALTDLARYQEALPFLQKAAKGDADRTWVYAWGQVYASSCYYHQEDFAQARQALILARDSGATPNVVHTAKRHLLVLGLAEEFDAWTPFESEHFSFRFSPRLAIFDRAGFAREHEAAYEKIRAWFGGGPEGKIRFFVWMDHAEATAAGMPQLGFSRPQYVLVHALQIQTLGHEMAHVISAHALKPTIKKGLINEGTSVYHDQTGRDTMVRARAAMAARSPNAPPVSLLALWEDWSLAEDSYSYPVAGAWVDFLITRGGKERFLEFFPDQSLAHARVVYGEDLTVWVDEFEAELARE